MRDATHRGSLGERLLQDRLGTRKRAERFYDLQVFDHLNDRMCAFIAERDLVFIATADGKGECDASLRSGAPGFVRVVDEKTLLYPEYRGNGVMASLGNMVENAHIALLFVDFTGARVGLHVNGTASVVERVDPVEPDAALWVRVSVVEAYIHCSKGIPRLLPADAERPPVPHGTGTADDDFFRRRRTAHGATLS